MKSGDLARERILNYVKAYWIENRASPSKREVMRDLGISSQAVLDFHLRKLAEAGVVVLVHGQHRSIIPVGLTIYFASPTENGGTQ